MLSIKSRFKQFLVILISLLLCIQSYGVFYAFSYSIEDYSTQEILYIIEDIVNWKKEDIGIRTEEYLLSPNFLQAAGTTAGDWYPIGIGRIGYPDDYNAYLAVIADQVSRRYQTKGKLDYTKATEWHRIGLAILSMGGDPTEIGRDEQGKPINLVAEGSYNRGQVTSLGSQGINGWIWGLILVDSMRYEVPEEGYYSREDIIVKILENQLEDGGFALYNGPADPDITAMAVQALAPYYNCEQTYTYHQKYIDQNVTKSVRQVIDEALEILSQLQLEDGDFSSWETENSESTAQVIVALCSLGIDILNDDRFIKNGNNLIDGLLKYRMDDGGFIHSKKYSADNPTSLPDQSNSMASEQALYALVAYCRYQEGLRSLYDFREDIDGNVQQQIDEVMTSIDNLPKEITDKDRKTIEEIYSQYLAIPIAERSYVYNYHILSEAMKILNIPNDSEPLATHMGLNEKGEGYIPTVFYDVTQEVGIEFTEQDVARVNALPVNLTTEYYVDVLKLLQKLENAANKDQYLHVIEKLQKKKSDIEKIEQEIEDLNREILDKLYPFSSLSIRDKRNIDEIVEKFEQLEDFDQQKVMGYEDVIKSKTKIDNQIRAFVISIVMLVIAAVTLYIVKIRLRKRKRDRLYQNMEIIDEDNN